MLAYIIGISVALIVLLFCIVYVTLCVMFIYYFIKLIIEAICCHTDFLTHTTMNHITSIIVDNLFDDWKTGKEPPQEGEVILLYDPSFHTLRCAKYDNQILMSEQRWINLMKFQASLVDICIKAYV